MDITMRALVPIGPQSIGLQERPVPQPGADEALVRVRGEPCPARRTGGRPTGGTAVMVGHGDEHIWLLVQDIQAGEVTLTGISAG